MTNLYLSLLDRMGAPAERVGDSTGKLEVIPFPDDNWWIERHPHNRPAGTFSPTGEKAGMRGRSDDSTASDWEMVSSGNANVQPTLPEKITP